MNAYDGLYGYQKLGVDYLVDHGGGFLWDEPGLGKTRQAIVAAKKLGGPVLVVCPNALKSWWRKEIHTTYPGDRILVADVGGRFGTKKYPIKLAAMTLGFPFWVVVHYEGVRINKEELGGIRWETVIADECHYFKNRDAMRTEAIMEITPPVASRIGLTATPFGKNPADLWAQMHWMMPTSVALRSYWKFFNTFVEYTVERQDSHVYRKITGGKNLEELALIMSGFGVQRTKSVVAPDLPPLTETPLPLTISAAQAKVYNLLRTTEAEAQMGDQVIVIPNVLARATRMEQLLSHPWMYYPDMKGTKLEWLLEWAEAFRYPAVIATRFRESAHHIAGLLGVRTAITGDLHASLRDGVLDRWRRGEEQFLVGTIATIGTGLNLQQAHAMICYDQLYNPIEMEQLKHRIHRVNSDHPVEVIYPYVEGTTNEVVYKSFSERLEQMQFVKMLLEHLQDQADENGGV
jgi:SWI/SNF-related matrix-associated actin-dependent regulator 1 of chromatin subfamily A